tara:strand:+ start:3565 stop:3717 length:153 start_codon:yes stop_codon:yes gene_type:complete
VKVGDISDYEMQKLREFAQKKIVKNLREISKLKEEIYWLAKERDKYARKG